MRLLLETKRPERFLRAECFRAGRAASPALTGQDQGDWIAVDRCLVARNELTLDESACDLSRLAITTDAGVGKTVAMEWLHAELNRPGGETLAFLFTFSHFPDRPDDFVRQALWPEFHKADGELSEEAVCRILDQLRREGRLVILVDGLDQTPPDGDAVECLRRLLEDPDWQTCRFVVSGRPYALQCHWAELFDGERGFDWRFVQLDEFNEQEQRAYLGDERYEAVPVEAREILCTPRVLKYLREDLPERELKNIKAAGDVYWHATGHLLKEGMKGSEGARRINLPPGEATPATVHASSYQRARKLLGAMAFEMVSELITTEHVPNFDGVPPNRFEAFKDRLVERLSGKPGAENRQNVDRDVDGLAALNEFLSRGIFDAGLTGLDSVYWRNRTLQEFFAAYWLAQFCTADDAQQLWAWIYLPDRPETEQYYWVWRFLCEMHADARNPDSWSCAVEPIYRPGDGTVEGTKRSSEMIYRAWPALEQTAEEGIEAAREVKAAFLGEFETQILDGTRGEEAKQAAKNFCDGFIEVQAGSFRMGSPPEKQGMPAEVKTEWQTFFDEGGDPETRAEEIVDRRNYAPTKRGQEHREERKKNWHQILSTGDIDVAESCYFPRNETPEQEEQKVHGFFLNRRPTENRWFRLFRPGHGETETYFIGEYAKCSPASTSPVIFVSWYDACAFCLWAHWQGRSCRLPHEHEWEYAAKAGTPWKWNYWWGDTVDAEKCCEDRNVGHSTPANVCHANPCGFEDIIGNGWEWCADRYRVKYDRARQPDGPDTMLRGGSWILIRWVPRSAFRVFRTPTLIVDDIGFRVARALD